MAKETKRESTRGAADEVAGKKQLDEEVLPNRGEPVEQRRTGGERRDTAGEHGRMAPETADAIERKAEESEKKEK